MSMPIAEETRPVETATAPEHILDPGTLGDHFDRLFRAAWALCGSREDAEDLVQETYASVLARPRLVRNDDDLGYLLRAVRNTFLNYRRRAARRPQATRSELESLELPDLRGATQPPAAAETREMFATIAALPAAFRDALVAVDVAGLSYGEAAKAMQVPEGTITSRLFRARDQVAKALSPALESPVVRAFDRIEDSRRDGKDGDVSVSLPCAPAALPGRQPPIRR
jgi:RNA polymerase sigma-70 factor (ECF subfamily)